MEARRLQATDGDVLPASLRSGYSLEQLIHLGDLHRCAYNLGEALRCFVDARALVGDPVPPDPRGVEVACRVADCQMERGELDLAAAALIDAERFAGETPDDSTRSAILGRHAMLWSASGDYAQATPACREAIDLLRESRRPDDIQFQGRLYLSLGHALERQGRTDLAGTAFEAALRLFESVADRRSIAHAYNNLGLNRKQRNRFREAIAFLHRALEVLDEVGDYGQKARTCLNLGIIHTRLGDWRQARSQLERAIQIAREVDHQGRVVKGLLALGALRMRCREYGLAGAAFDEAESLAHANGYRREQVLAQEFRGELLLLSGQPAKGLEVLLAAHEASRLLAPEGDVSCEILRRIAEAHLALGDGERASEWAQKAAGAAEKLGDQTELAAARRVTAVARMMGGDIEGATALFASSIEGFRRIGSPYEEARTHLAVVRSALSVADRSLGDASMRHHLASARDGFERLGVPGHLAEVLLAGSETCLRRGDLEEAEQLLRIASRYVEASEESSLLEHQFRLRSQLDRLHREDLEENGVVSPGHELHRLFREGDLESAVGAFLTMALRRTGSDRAFVAQGPNLESLKVLASSGLSESDAQGLMGSLGGELRACMESGLPAVRRADETMPGTLQGLSGFAVAPLCLPADIWGVLYLDRKQQHVVGPYRQSDLRLIAFLAELATISVLALERRHYQREREKILKGLEGGSTFSRPILYRSRAIESVLITVRKVADSPASVLLHGETGTGKGLFARAIHEAGARRDRPFVQINCATLPETLLESELFGHVTGAFTGAVKTKRGLFEEAEGGTVLLDEVDKTSRAVQAKLLHVLDHREIRPLGANRWKRVDARIISATNADLKAMIQRGEFLEDLYYRLNDISIYVPPLRERPGDIELLVHHFVSTFAAEMKRDACVLAPEVLDRLLSYEWPGNVRELEKVARRLVVMGDEGVPIAFEHLPRELQGVPGTNGSGATLRSAVQGLERQLIQRTLAECSGNKSAVSRRLRISYPALLSKIRRYGLS